MVYVCVEIGYILEAGGDSPAIFGEHGSGVELMFGCAEYRIVHVQIAVIGFDRPMGVNTVSASTSTPVLSIFPVFMFKGVAPARGTATIRFFPSI